MIPKITSRDVRRCSVITANIFAIGVAIISLTTSTSAIDIVNLNYTNLDSKRTEFYWDIIDLETENNTDGLRAYIVSKYNLGIISDEGCQDLNMTSKIFELRPYTAYTACVNIVRDGPSSISSSSSSSSSASTSSGDRCRELPRLLTSDRCIALITDFEPWSAYNIIAIACTVAIAIILLVSALIEFTSPKEDFHDSLSKKQMRKWSKMKRKESAADWMRTLERSRSRSGMKPPMIVEVNDDSDDDIEEYQFTGIDDLQ